MQDSPKNVFTPDELAMLSEVLNEVLGARGTEDEVASHELASRLAQLLLNLFTTGITDRAKLTSLLHRAAIRTLN
jgi:hypothetical protein